MRKLIGVVLLLLVFTCGNAAARSSQATLYNTLQYYNDVCLEIGRTSVVPRVCKKPSRMLYKGVYCFGCPEASRCNPKCTGGKVCINARCICPPKKLLIDCKGRCQSPTIPCKF